MSTTVDPEPATARSWPSGRHRARHGPTSSRRSPGGSCRTACRSSIVDLPGRPLVSASMVVIGGAAEEPADQAGATVLAARALTEGTERHDAIALVEAAERLGASLHAEAGWDALTRRRRRPGRPPGARPRPRRRGPPPVRPFPEPEVERLRDERLNDLLQAQADPRRRVEEAFVGTIYAVELALSPAIGRDARDRRGPDVRPAPRGLPADAPSGASDPDRRRRPRRPRMSSAWPSACSGRGTAPARPRPHPRTIVDTGTSVGRLVRVIHRPGSVQTEIRVGHRGLPAPDRRTSTPSR